MRYHCIHTALGLALLLAGASGAQAQSTVAGVISGALSVDETGSAGYTLPIAVPPGIAGMQPSVALVYQSHGGNGTTGVGWGLSAASSIHRCSQTLVQDGAIHGVDFFADDRFCLDGQRLVAIAGTYGADGTEYRTEIESFARIISHGSAGTGPLFFTVETKSGRTLEYGNTTDSRLGVPGASEIRLWSLNEVADTLGNAMSYHYVEDTNDKSYRLDHIAYTRNDGESVTPQSEVRFLYEARPDSRSSFLAGAELAMTQRLAAIETWTDTGSGLALVKSYDLTYETSPATSRSRLTSVTECDPSDNCLEPLSSEWMGEAAGYLNETVTNSWTMSASSWAADKRIAYVLDYNGDGRDDVLLQGKTKSYSSILLTSNGNGFDVQNVTNAWGMSASWWMGQDRKLFVLDHNGDGLSDILLQGSASSHGSALLTSNGSGFTFQNVTNAWGMSASWWKAQDRRLFVLDYNGDGLSDILLQGIASSHGSALLTSNGSGFTFQNVTNAWGMSAGWWKAQDRRLFVLDYNGDGLSDILLQGIASSHGSALLTSNGSGFSFQNVTNAWGMSSGLWMAQDRKLFVLDSNGDGISDVFLQGTTGIHGNFLLTSNSSSFDVQNVTNSWGMSIGLWAASNRNIALLDYNGDGLTDFLMQGISNSQATLLLTHESPAPDLLVSITDSLGRVSTIEYAPLTDGDVYSKDGDAVFPVVDIQAPLYVVKSVSSDDGVGGQRVTSYSYAGAKVHVQGRGFRGFRQMTATDEQTGIVTTTEYSQGFPTTAQVLSSVKTLADGTTTIKTLANTWDALSLNNGATVWPYVASSTSGDYEPNDGPANTPVVTRMATATFDSFGNPTELETETVGGGETFTETTENTYSNDTTNWFLGLLTRSEVTRTRPAAP
jgi:hypothetical protein